MRAGSGRRGSRERERGCGGRELKCRGSYPLPRTGIGPWRPLPLVAQRRMPRGPAATPPRRSPLQLGRRWRWRVRYTYYASVARVPGRRRWSTSCVQHALKSWRTPQLTTQRQRAVRGAVRGGGGGASWGCARCRGSGPEETRCRGGGAGARRRGARLRDFSAAITRVVVHRDRAGGPSGGVGRRRQESAGSLGA